MDHIREHMALEREIALDNKQLEIIREKLEGLPGVMNTIEMSYVCAKDGCVGCRNRLIRLLPEMVKSVAIVGRYILEMEKDGSYRGPNYKILTKAAERVDEMLKKMDQDRRA